MRFDEGGERGRVRRDVEVGEIALGGSGTSARIIRGWNWAHGVKGEKTTRGSWAPPNPGLLRDAQRAEPLEDQPADKRVQVRKHRANCECVRSRGENVNAPLSCGQQPVLQSVRSIVEIAGGGNM